MPIIKLILEKPIYGFQMVWPITNKTSMPLKWVEPISY